MWVGAQRHAPAGLSPRKTLYPFYRRPDGLQSRSGRMRKISPPTGIRSPDGPTSSEPIYRLSYPDRCSIYIYIYIYIHEDKRTFLWPRKSDFMHGISEKIRINVGLQNEFVILNAYVVWRSYIPPTFAGIIIRL